MPTKDEFIQWEAASQDTIDVKRIYIDMAGDLVAGVWLSQLLYYFLPVRDRKSGLMVKSHRLIQLEDGEDWVRMNRTEWWPACRIKDRQIDYLLDVYGQEVRKGQLQPVKGKSQVPLVLYQNRMHNFKKTPHLRPNWPVFLDLFSKHLDGYKGGSGAPIALDELPEDEEETPREIGFTDFGKSVSTPGDQPPVDTGFTKIGKSVSTSLEATLSESVSDRFYNFSEIPLPNSVRPNSENPSDDNVERQTTRDKEEQQQDGATRPDAAVVPLNVRDDVVTPPPPAPPPPTPKSTFPVSPETIIQSLIAAGVSDGEAQKLAATHGLEACQAQLEALPLRNAKNPGALLAKSIRESWAMPPDLEDQRAAAERARQARERQEKQTAAERQVQYAFDTAAEEFDDLSEWEQNALVEDVVAAKPLLGHAKRDLEGNWSRTLRAEAIALLIERRESHLALTAPAPPAPTLVPPPNPAPDTEGDAALAHLDAMWERLDERTKARIEGEALEALEKAGARIPPPAELRLQARREALALKLGIAVGGQDSGV